jgi:hypothetical protein
MRIWTIMNETKYHLLKQIQLGILWGNQNILVDGDTIYITPMFEVNTHGEKIL